MAGGRSGSDIVLDVAATRERSAYALRGYRSVPARGAGRGILVVGEQGSVSALARDAADRLARAGFVALAPELGGDAPVSTLGAGVSALLDDHAVDGARVGALGFGRGGVLALTAAASQRRIGAVIDFYGLPHTDEVAALDELEAPSLLLFGARDTRVDAEGLQALAGRIPSARLHVEPDAGEDYMDAANPDRHSAVAAASGWDHALAFLEAAL